jgi:hypothetical protein
MKRCIPIAFVLLFYLGTGLKAQVLPEVPRISAYEAYIKYKSGKAIIVHAGGEAYYKRHITGALDVDGDGVAHKGKPLPNFPKRGIEIIIYCY